MDLKLEVVIVPVGDVGRAKAAPGSLDGLLLAVDDIEKARAELADRGVDVSKEITERLPGRV